MGLALAAGVITQSGTDTSLAGLSGIAGVTTTVAPAGMRFYSVDATVTLLRVTGDLSWDSDYECLILSPSTRVEQDAGATATIGTVATVNGKTRYSRGTGLVMNRSPGAIPNTSSANWWVKSSTSLALGGKFVLNGGQVKSAGAVFLGTTTNPAGQFATIELNGRAEMMNIASAASQMIRAFADPSGVQVKSSVLSGRTAPMLIFSSLGYGALAADVDFASFQCDGNGPKDPVTVLNAALADNKATVDYTYVAAVNALANVNKYIFKNSDVGSALRTGSLSPTNWRIGAVEIRRDARFKVADSAGAALSGVVSYMRLAGASINPSGRYAGLDDYVTPRTYISQTDAAGVTAVSDVLYAIAQSYATSSADAGTPLPMESLTTRAGDVQDGYLWSYGHLLGPLAAPMRGVNTLTVDWTLFKDPAVTLTEANARAKLASSFTVNATTKVITVTADSGYQDLYDALKAYKATANKVNLEATPIADLVVRADGTRLVGYTGWTLVVNAGVTLTAGGKYSSVYFDTITVAGAISGQYADSTGAVVTVRDTNSRPMSTFITINGVPEGGTVVAGTFRAGWVPLAVARQIKVQPTDQVRIYANYFGSKPGVINALGSEVEKFTIVLDSSPAIDTSVPLATRNAIADSFASLQNGGNIEVTVNRSMGQYTPAEVISGFGWYLVSYGYLIASAMVQTGNANIYRLEQGTVISFAANYKLRMADTDVLGASILPSITGYQFPLVAYYDDGTGSKLPLTLLNAHGAKVELAQWTQIEAAISDLDKQDIADTTAVEVWTADTRTLTSGGGGGGGSGATAEEVWTYATRTLTSEAPPTLAQIEGSTVLAKEATVETRLAASAYTAPDNAGITAIKAKTDTLANSPTAEQTAAAVLAAAVEPGASVVQSLRLANAVLHGKVSGAGTGTEVFRDLADTKDRVVSSVDTNGNRTEVTRDGT